MAWSKGRASSSMDEAGMLDNARLRQDGMHLLPSPRCHSRIQPDGHPYNQTCIQGLDIYQLGFYLTSNHDIYYLSPSSLLSRRMQGMCRDPVTVGLWIGGPLMTGHQLRFGPSFQVLSVCLSICRSVPSCSAGWGGRITSTQGFIEFYHLRHVTDNSKWR